MQFLNNLSLRTHKSHEEGLMDFWADAKTPVRFQVSNVNSPVAKKKLQMCHFTKRWVVSLYKGSAKVTWIRGCRASRVDDCRSSTWLSFHSPFLSRCMMHQSNWTIYKIYTLTVCPIQKFDETSVIYKIHDIHNTYRHRYDYDASHFFDVYICPPQIGVSFQVCGSSCTATSCIDHIQIGWRWEDVRNRVEPKNSDDMELFWWRYEGFSRRFVCVSVPTMDVDVVWHSDTLDDS